MLSHASNLLKYFYPFGHRPNFYLQLFLEIHGKPVAKTGVAWGSPPPLSTAIVSECPNGGGQDGLENLPQEGLKHSWYTCSKVRVIAITGILQ